MANKFIDLTGLTYFWTSKVKAYIDSKVQSINSTIDTLSQTVGTKASQTDLDDLASIVGTNTGNISTLSGKVTTNTGNISTNATNISTNTTNIGKNTSAINTINGEIDDLQDLTETHTTQIAARLESSKVIASKNAAPAATNVYNAAYVNSLETQISGSITNTANSLTVEINKKLDADTAESTYAKKTDLVNLFDFKGTITASGIPDLTKAQTVHRVYEGYVYNISERFTSNALFIDFQELGSAQTYPAGTNIVAVKVNPNEYDNGISDSTGALMWDVIGGSIAIDAITDAEIDAAISIT